jgi:hypothetical protein
MKIKIHKALKTTVKLIISFQLFLGLRNLFPLPDVLTSFWGREDLASWLQSRSSTA